MNSFCLKIVKLCFVNFLAPEVLNKEELSMATDVWNIGVFAALL